jgi:hypothetical protein
MPEMKDLIGTMIRSLGKLGNVLFFLVFIFGIFAIFGVNQFSGQLYNRCRTAEEPITVDGVVQSWPMVDIEGWLCSSNSTCATQVEDGEPHICGNSAEAFGISAYEIDSVID